MRLLCIVTDCKDFFLDQLQIIGQDLHLVCICSTRIEHLEADQQIVFGSSYFHIYFCYSSYFPYKYDPLVMSRGS